MYKEYTNEKKNYSVSNETLFISQVREGEGLFLLTIKGWHLYSFRRRVGGRSGPGVSEQSDPESPRDDISVA